MNKIYTKIAKLGIVTILLFLLSALTVVGQTPTTFNYQAVLRDASGHIHVSTAVSIQLVIHQETETGTTVYSEVHNATTTEFGLVNLEIGSVTPASFATINWAAGPYFVEVIVNGTSMGTSELLTVPYALYAVNGVPGPQGIQGEKGDKGDTGDPGVITDNSVGSNHVIDNSLTAADLAPNSVGASELDASAFSNWDQDESDDFDGNYSSLSGAPTNVSSFTNDAGYLTAEVDGSTTNEIQSLGLSGTSLNITSGNTVDLEGVANRTIQLPAQALNYSPSSPVITQYALGLLWQQNYAGTAYIILKKPSNYISGNVTLELFFRTTSATAGVVAFFIRPRSVDSGDGFYDASSLSGTPVNVSGTIGGGTMYEQTFTILSSSLANDWWIISIQRQGTGSTYSDDVHLLSVALTY